MMAADRQVTVWHTAGERPWRITVANADGTAKRELALTNGEYAQLADHFKEDR